MGCVLCAPASIRREVGNAATAGVKKRRLPPARARQLVRLCLLEIPLFIALVDVVAVCGSPLACWPSCVRGSQQMQFRAEAFNVLNHPNWSGANSNPNSGLFGLVTSKTGERNVQLRYSF
jgi:hypothetical protein